MTFPSKKTGRALRLTAGALAVSAVAGCFTLGVGLDPPLHELYYPTAILTSPGHHALYVVNSDFDIQYTGGTVQSVDLDSVRACVKELADDLRTKTLRETGKPWESVSDLCGSLGLGTNDNTVLQPGPCAAIDLDPPSDISVACIVHDDPSTPNVKEGAVLRGRLIKESTVIGAFASSATLVGNPSAKPQQGDSRERLFVAVRGDPSVTYFDTTNDAAGASDAFRLDCKQIETDARPTCPPGVRVGKTASQSDRLLTLPVEPTGIAASDDGAAIVTVHQTGGASSKTGGQASLVVNAWGALPTLEFTLAGLPDFPSDIASIPTSAFVAAKNAEGGVFDYRPGFLVSFHAAPEVDLLRYFDDSSGTSRHFLQRVGAFTIATNSDGSDSRGIAVSDASRRRCEADCSASDLACLRKCVDTPLDVYVANRTPSSLLIGRLDTALDFAGGDETSNVTGISEKVSIFDMVPLAAGPSRVVVGDVLDQAGKRSPRVFVISFDSRYIVIYDPAQKRVEATVRTGRGPHAMALDLTEPAADGTGGSAFLYVAHFTDSYIGVVDLDARHTETYASMFASVGVPNPPKESQ